MLDCTYRVEVPHRTGQLARVMGAIAAGEGLIGDVVTLSVGREASVREITVEVRDGAQAQRISDLIDAIEGVRVLWHQDRALMRHQGGKLRIEPIHRVHSVQQMRDVYTPGVARVCTAIAQRPELAHRYTMIPRSVAICTNGSRVLGLGNIGPVASMPVMEGKAVFYAQFAGISATPILLETGEVEEFVETVVRIAPTFGGIHLEDISAPECFEIERRLIERLSQPVMHDDVHGTAVVSVAATIVACQQAGVELRAATVGQLGLGAAGFGIASLMVQSGARRVIAFDPLNAARERVRALGVQPATMERVLSEADVVIATTGRAGLIEPSMVRRGQVILALTNPDPEIEPERAERAGAVFAADGRSVNNVLGYPGIFRGALQAGAREINVEMKLAAARELAGLAGEGQLVPDALDQRVHEAVAKAVREAAQLSGAARPEHAAVDL
ncbi:MAG: NAD-dependent malic enzyme [Solirubrobacterales bacterium]|nr:NAD-dependent malic enzyme [Solirubrobacterales bacterium]MBV9168156.1 NAD-dependent malic enzyme [Solirubrobacterales bacterium]MBV9536487.1 NAD-dependent malic enzyme [Solirubrobacterales bacterium]